MLGYGSLWVDLITSCHVWGCGSTPERLVYKTTTTTTTTATATATANATVYCQLLSLLVIDALAHFCLLLKGLLFNHVNSRASRRKLAQMVSFISVAHLSNFHPSKPNLPKRGTFLLIISQENSSHMEAKVALRVTTDWAICWYNSSSSQQIALFDLFTLWFDFLSR